MEAFVPRSMSISVRLPACLQTRQQNAPGGQWFTNVIEIQDWGHNVFRFFILEATDHYVCWTCRSRRTTQKRDKGFVQRWMLGGRDLGWGEGDSYSGFFTGPGNMSSGTSNAIPQGSHTRWSVWYYRPQLFSYWLRRLISSLHTNSEAGH